MAGNRRWELSALTVAILVSCASAPPAAATVIAWMPHGDTLYGYDLMTGALVDQVGLDLTIHPTGATWSAAGDLMAVAGIHLLAIDPATGEVEVRAVLDLQDEYAMGLAEDACGRLFLSLIAFEPDRLEIRRVDPATGTTEPVVALDAQITGPLAARGGNLYLLYGSATNGLVVLEVDPDAGTMVEHAIDPVGGYPFGGLDFGPDGALWLGHYRPPIGIPPPPPPVKRIDLATGAVTEFPALYLFPAAIGPAAGTCGGSSPLPIPAASPLGLAALALLLAAAGAVALGRR